MPGPGDLLPDQMGRQRAAFIKGFRGAAEQGILVVLQAADGAPGAHRVADIEHLVDLLPAR
ncbi:hypothetical protein D3C71_2069460 [compost metagenome]